MTATINNPQQASDQELKAKLFKELGLTGKSKVDDTKKDLASSETFMKLFLTQLRCQNPLDDTQDPTKFVSQLAQFSQVESAQKMNDSLKNIDASLKANKVMDAAALIGRKVSAPSKEVVLHNVKQQDDGTLIFDKIRGKVALPDIPGHNTKDFGLLYYDDVILNITAPNGEIVLQHKLDKQESGSVVEFDINEIKTITDYLIKNIDKLDQSKLKITAHGVLGNKSVPATTLMGVTVTGVRIENNNFIATTENDMEVPISNLTHIY